LAIKSIGREYKHTQRRIQKIYQMGTGVGKKKVSEQGNRRIQGGMEKKTSSRS